MSSLNPRRTRSSSSVTTTNPNAPFHGQASGRDGAALPTSAATATVMDHRFNEEMDEIKRYEDFTTIDWVQDAAREQLRRRARRRENGGPYQRRGRWGVRHKIWELYDAGQAWIVVTFVGAAIGLNAAFLNIVTEWLSDVKRGHCTTAFYLNENFCCWGAEDGMWQWGVPPSDKVLMLAGCDEWHRWSGIWPVNYFLYFVFSVSHGSSFSLQGLM